MGSGVGNKNLKVVVVDMQPISPAVGGGRQRLLGLYHALGESIEAVYVGSYDWPGESLRDEQLTPGLREVVVPLSDEHHTAAAAAAAQMGGRVIIDCIFSEQVHLSAEYLRVARAHMADADVVVFSHPWAYPALIDDIQASQLVVYDSQNVESVLRTDLHGDILEAKAVLRTVVAAEYALCQRADLVLACSHDDRETFAKLYGTRIEKMRVVPNGIFALANPPCDAASKQAIKRELGVGERDLCIFVGSNYGPNNDAARFIATDLAYSLPEVTFAIVGGCGTGLANLPIEDNVILLGILDEADKRRWLDAADVALNPLAQGSGTSIKMFDFMAAGIPVLTTVPGARGIAQTGKNVMRLASREHSARALRTLLADGAERAEIATNARKLVEDFYAWERISPRTGRLLRAFHQAKLFGSATFSVVIPSYERPDHLERLFACLAKQLDRDFEVIVIDQSRGEWHGARQDWGFRLTYVHSPVRGAVKARNAGGELATGKFIAFTDDDCEPLPDWLSNARVVLSQPGVIGVEGRVESDHADDPEWRPVCNVSFAGLGFMTANLFVKNEVFQALDGFDLAFDEPHFREDTEFGWRMQQLGEVPYGEDVRVFHPAHPRDQLRESSVERNKFFEKDALLFKKHPERYMQLFLAESHWSSTPGFWENFEIGMKKYGVESNSQLATYRDMYR
jgi:glycosyltransferase involved in cell wall biosynthesis